MNSYQSLLWPDAALVTPSKKNKSPKRNLRGCEYCPQNNAPGIRKIKGTVEGKSIMVWAQSPGPTENAEGRELIGRAGKWFWARMAEAGIRRSDCDIQNVVRCFPADRIDGRLVMRDPSKEEIFCCSVYNESAIAKSRAKVHIILGQVAAKQLLGNKATSEKIFWSEKLSGRVILLDHPAYFIRGFASKEKLRSFRTGLQAAVRYAKEKGGRFSYLEQQDYAGITDIVSARKVAAEIRESAKRVRISADLEDGWVEGKRVALCYGFSTRAGWARSFLLQHPGPKVSQEEREAIQEIVAGLLQDENIRKVAHGGTYDVEQTIETMGCELRGFDFDSRYSEYFKYPGRRSYALAEIVAVRFPEFAGFKEVVMPEAAPPGKSYDWAYKAGKLDFAKVPWEKLVLRNCADADLTKRIEVSTKKFASAPLLRVYMDAAFTLERMRDNGPWFDYKQCELLGEIYPARLKKQKAELQLMAGDPNLNPGSPEQVCEVIYEKLKLPYEGKKPNTQKHTLEKIAHLHPFVPAVSEYRKDSKIESTYRMGFKKCADEYGGRLKTKWWLTGTKTGRLSSGGSREGAEERTINLQNIHGEQQLQNLLVSDVGWRDIYRAWKDEHELNKEWWKPFLNRKVYLVLDYSQMELRFLAQSSGDQLLIQQFNSGKDIHCLVGHEMTGWPEELIAKSRKKRVLIKGFHFGILYGLTIDGLYERILAQGVKVKRQRVAEMYRRYFERYGMVKSFISRMRRMAELKGYVENLLGFRCPIDTTGNEKGGFWANLAVNAPIQGGAHQLLLIALAILQRKPKTFALIRTPEAEIHDALNIPVLLKDLFEALQLAKKLLQESVLRVLREDFNLDWQVPLLAEAKAGFRYGVTVEISPETTMGEFMNRWCEENQKSQRALYKELREIRKAIPVK